MEAYFEFKVINAGNFTGINIKKNEYPDRIKARKVAIRILKKHIKRFPEDKDAKLS